MHAENADNYFHNFGRSVESATIKTANTIENDRSLKLRQTRLAFTGTVVLLIPQPQLDTNTHSQCTAPPGAL